MSLLNQFHSLCSINKRKTDILPPFTVRFKANRAVSPSDFNIDFPITLILIDDVTHTYDVTIGQEDWEGIFGAEPYNTWLTEVIAANTSGVTNMGYMFYNCALLTSIPLFDMSSVTLMARMFFRCLNVERGALAIYRQVSEKLDGQWRYLEAFYDCGADTVTGLAELQQIPKSWGGLMETMMSASVSNKSPISENNSETKDTGDDQEISIPVNDGNDQLYTGPGA